MLFHLLSETTQDDARNRRPSSREPGVWGALVGLMGATPRRPLVFTRPPIPE